MRDSLEDVDVMLLPKWMLHFLRQKQTLISELLTQMCAHVRVCAPALPAADQSNTTNSLGGLCIGAVLEWVEQGYLASAG